MTEVSADTEAFGSHDEGVDFKNSTFFALHRAGNPFILPNAWDLGSARILAAEGFPAIGTTSLGVAAAHGLPDGTRDTRELTSRLCRTLTAELSCPVTCDVEDGYFDDPGDVARFVAALHVNGVNIEDATGGRLIDPRQHAAKVTAIKRSCPGVFVNARTDTYWLGQGGLDETVSRARRYVAAGADGVFVPGDLDADDIQAITTAVDRPVNVLATPRHTGSELAGLGVARISTGSLLYRAAVARVREVARAVRDSAPTPEAISYAHVQELNRRLPSEGVVLLSPERPATT